MSDPALSPGEVRKLLGPRLTELKATGPDGFEGLAALLMEQITGQPFTIAATGRQPHGDATSLGGRISLQAKRYKQSTALNPMEVATDLLSACDAAGGTLDVYVVVATRESTQLKTELEKYEEHTGVDVVVIADDEHTPELTALCLAHWDRARAFFPSFDTAQEGRLLSTGGQPWVTEAVDRVRKKIALGLRTFLRLRQQASAALERRFRTVRATAAAGGRIDLSLAVHRAAPIAALRRWWIAPPYPLAHLEAEEGNGKTWVAAEFAERLATEPDGTAVFWLESAEWTGCTTINAVLSAALRTALPAGDQRLELFRVKILRHWPKPVLLVLDGVNERDCLPTAQQLLGAYTRHAESYAPHLRLLFTTRPLSLAQGYEPDVWERSCAIALSGFTPAEFDEALRRFAPNVRPESIPGNVRAIASIPRFFRLALRLRDRLRDLGQLTKPMLLFEDLLDKIERRRLPNLFPTAESAEQILAHWARHAQRTASGTLQVADEHIQQCCRDYARAWTDLAENGLAEKRIGSAALKADHVTLGFALHLLHVAEQRPAVEVSALVDELAEALEPNREDDVRTEALYVAALVSLVRPPVAGTWRAAQSALLCLWAGSHNAQHLSTRLVFWAHREPDVYHEVVEFRFREYLSGAGDLALITPLARHWHDADADHTLLQQRLERWLTLVYPAVDREDTEDDAAERSTYPLAHSIPQLRLAAAALSILSQRPDRAFLPVLVRSARSCAFCTQPEELNGKRYRSPYKTPYEALGLLLEWHYTETILPDLERLAASVPPHLRGGVWTLAECLDRAELPAVLQRPTNNPVTRYSEPPDRDLNRLQEWLQLLPRSDPHWPSLFHFELLCESPSLALAPEKGLQLANYLITVLRSAKGIPGIDEAAEAFPPLLPCLAKFATIQLPAVATAYAEYALRSKNSGGASISSPLVPLPISNWHALATTSEAAADKPGAKDLWGWTIHLAESLLLSAPETELLSGFETVLKLPPATIGEVWNILPIPQMLAEIRSPALVEQCWTRFEAAGAEGAASRATLYWLGLTALLSRENEVVRRRALAKVKRLPIGHPWVPLLARMIATSAVPELVCAAFKDPSFTQHLPSREVQHSLSWFFLWPRGTPLPASLHTLLPTLPDVIVAALLELTNGEVEHVAFARMLAGAAATQVAKAGVTQEPGYVMRWHQTLDDKRPWWHLYEAEEDQTFHSRSSLVWGVDRSPRQDFAVAMEEHLDPDSATKRTAELRDALQRARKKIEAVAGNFSRPLGPESLDHWSRSAPAEVRSFAEKFLASLSQSSGHFELAAFSEELLAAVALTDLRAALQLHELYFDRSRSCLLLEGIVPKFVERLMSSVLDNQGEFVAAERARWIEGCADDRELLAVVLASMHGGTAPAVHQLIRDKYLPSPLARERALAVSLLAFLAEDEQRTWLRERSTADDSQWVRAHARWASEVQRRSVAARDLWMESESEAAKPDPDLLQLAALFIRMEPLLPPTAIFWRRARANDSRVRALQTSFWYSWRNRGGARSERAIANRRLKEYCRGYKLGDEARRMAPWWKP